MRVLLTGISGFIGAHTVEHILTTTDWSVVGIASFRHRGDPVRVLESQHFDPSRVTMLYHDLRAPITGRLADQLAGIDFAINMAAESHVDRSITEPATFIENNVLVTLNMLEWARVARPKVFVQISTDEVYGPAPAGISHAEWSTHLPSNPYAASKAAQEDIAIAYWRTYGIPLVITNTMNNFGERQEPEKFIPMVLGKVLRDELVTIHGQDGKPGSRFYLHARNHADALVWLLQAERHEYDAGPCLPEPSENGSGHQYHSGETHCIRCHKALFGVSPPLYPDALRPARYNIVGEREIDNLEMAQMIAGYAHRDLRYEIVNFHASRPGHDLRYGLDDRKTRQFGWTPPMPLDASLKRTIDWTLTHREWLR